MVPDKGKVILGISTLATVVFAVMVFVFVPASFPSKSYAPDVNFRIEKGESLNTIAQSLYSAGLVRSEFLFKVYAIATNQSKNLKAGLYRLSGEMSISDLTRIFSQGLYQSEDIVVTIPEGSNIADIDVIFSVAKLAAAGEFLNGSTIRNEGFLFPDSYRFALGAKKDDIIEKLRENFNRKTKHKYSKYEVIIASILEKEVKTPEDMRVVAGVILRRLSLNRPLEIDATATYGYCFLRFVKGERCDVSKISVIDAIALATPYNTYKIGGLPPEPISNPGLVAMEAAHNPQATDYLYYLSTKDGRTIFSKTAIEHIAARKKYLGF